MPLLLNQTDAVHLLRIRVTALVMPYSCRSVFYITPQRLLYRVLTILSTAFAQKNIVKMLIF